MPSRLRSSPEEFGTRKAREAAAQAFVDRIVGHPERGRQKGSKRVSPSTRELGSVPWVFSHLKLLMHVQLFQLSEDPIQELPATPLRRWVTADQLNDESMGTGMRKCWGLVKNSDK